MAIFDILIVFKLEFARVMESECRLFFGLTTSLTKSVESFMILTLTYSIS